MARKLIFYSTVGPDRDDSAFFPFNHARRCAEAGLEVEVFLAGPASGLLRADVRGRLEGRPKDTLEAILEAKVPILVSLGCAKKRGVSSLDLDECGAKPGDITQMWIEVAEGAALIPYVEA